MSHRLRTHALFVAVVAAPHLALAFQVAPRQSLPHLPEWPAVVASTAPNVALAALEVETGSRWDVRWDAWTGVARRGRGGAASGRAAPVDAATARSLALDCLRHHGALWGADRAALRPVLMHPSARAWHATWIQEDGGRPILGAALTLSFTADGRFVAFASSLVPGLQAPRSRIVPEDARRVCAAFLGQTLAIETSEEVVAVLPAPGYSAVPALRLLVRSPQGGRWQAILDAGSLRLLEIEDLVRTLDLAGTATGAVRPLYAQDPLRDVAFPWLLVRLGHGTSEDSTTTAADGSYSFAAPAGDAEVRTALDGLFVRVDNQDLQSSSPQLVMPVAVPGTVPLHLTAAHARDDERTIYYHTNVIHDRVKARFGFTRLDFAMPAVAAVRNPMNGDPSYSNAFWDGERMAFGNGGIGNFGLFADVIYHEYTHAITDYAYRPVGGLRGPLGAAIHEGLSDYFACTLTEEPLVGEYLGSPTGFRNLDNELLWPEDRDPEDEEHRNGEIFAGALWHVRARIGPEAADAVVHFARELFPQTFEEYLEAMLLQDDFLFGDGAPGNGSPHHDAILAAFARHGIGPLAERVIRIEHAALADVEDPGLPRRVEARVGALVYGSVDGMRLHHAVDGVWTVQPMLAEASGGFSGTLPALPEGARMSYYLSAYRTRPYEEVRLPATAPDSVFSYRVGPDLEPPRLAHAPLQEVPAFGWPPELAVRIEDNLGVAYAYAEVWQEGTPAGTIGFAPSPGEPHVFVARLPNTGGDVGTHFEYAITAVDRSRAGNTVRLPASGRLGGVVVEDLRDDFERGAGSWRHRAVVLAKPDPWHLSLDFNHGPTGQQAWLCGVSNGTYPPLTASALVSDWFRIDAGAQASIWSWMDAEENGPTFAFDGGIVEVQREGESQWELLIPLGGYDHEMTDTGGANVLAPGMPCLSGRDRGWRLLQFDLGPWSGQRVRLRFLFGSDDVGVLGSLRGWLLDDFELIPGTRNPTDLVTPPGWAGTVLERPPWPNPTRASVHFDLDVPAGQGAVVIEIVDARGRRVERLLDNAAVGRRSVVWRPLEAAVVPPPGMYLYRVLSGLGTRSGKLLLLR